MGAGAILSASSPVVPDNSFLGFLANPWAVNHWRAAFGHRAGLANELALLERVFPPPWLEATLVGRSGNPRDRSSTHSRTT